MKKPLADMNGCFISGKFAKNNARPDIVLSTALNSFFGTMLETDEALPMKWRIHDAIGYGNNDILLDVLPNLRRWLADGTAAATPGTETGAAKGIESSHRLKFMFCKLVGAIACKTTPVCLFLDDLQWGELSFGLSSAYTK